MASTVDRKSILEAVKNPLVFFALALLIAESLVGLLAATSSPNMLPLSFLAVAMFVTVVSLVMWMTVSHPIPLSATAKELIDFEVRVAQKVKLSAAKMVLEGHGSTVEKQINRVDLTPKGTVPISEAPPPPKKGR